MDKSEKVQLIRKGNELFNEGNVYQALQIFVKTGYRDGILRAADHIYYEKKQPLMALKFYRMINRQDRVDEIFGRMMFAFSKLVRDEEPSEEKNAPGTDENGDIEVKIHPKLKILAEEIIREYENK